MDKKKLSLIAMAGEARIPSKTVKANVRDSKSSKSRSAVSALEGSFGAQLASSGLPKPLCGKNELAFHEKRKWRFDFAWPDLMVALEIEGGTYSHGKEKVDRNGHRSISKSRHLTATGFHEDCIKYCEEAILGWSVLRVDAKMVKDGTALSLLKRAIRAKVQQKSNALR